ncbi:hypothetical protein THS27_08580 [Thalassospira sp. MCCC 1A01428]|nr:hypothetical protein THS27_08580 [Thalassospira sp. MCCC 1A01428]
MARTANVQFRNNLRFDYNVFWRLSKFTGYDLGIGQFAIYPCFSIRTRHVAIFVDRFGDAQP